MAAMLLIAGSMSALDTVSHSSLCEAAPVDMVLAAAVAPVAV